MPSSSQTRWRNFRAVSSRRYPPSERGNTRSSGRRPPETWEAMEELTKLGLVKAIGVANFTGPMLVDLLTYAKVVPAVNQIELHPYNPQTKLIEFCTYHGIGVTAYSPLGSPGGMANPKDIFLLKDEVLGKIAGVHGKTPAQVLLRWGIQRGTVVIPKSVNPEHIMENSQVFDFILTEDEMVQLTALGRHHRYVDPWEWWRIPYFD
ncbi:MAG: aldo/keto reductase [Patescibacteria group bacterium]